MFSLNNKAQLHRCDVGNLPSRAGSVWLGSAFLLLHGARRWLPARAALAQDQTRRISGSSPCWSQTRSRQSRRDWGEVCGVGPRRGAEQMSWN